MRIKDYIEQNWNDCFFDVSFSIKGYSKRLEAIMKANPALAKDLTPILKCETLSRQKVFDWIKKDSYQGFLAAMLWGGISTVDSKKKKSNAERAFSVERKKVEGVLTKTVEFLKQGKEGEAFDYLYNGNGKIDGIGTSYLTKIMYFFSPGEPDESLIFDRWGRFMHAAFLIDDNTAKDFYSFRYKEKFKSELHSKKAEREVYLDYLVRMRSIKKKGMTSAGHLEAFLFGKKLYNSNQNDNNPRYFLYNKALGYYTGNIIPQTERSKHEGQVLPLNPGQTIRGRVVFAGYDIPYGGRRYYLFVGMRGKYHFIGLLTHKEGEALDGCTLVPKLERRGFNKKGKGYIYKRLEPYNEAAAIAELEAIKSIMTDGQRH